MCVCMNHSGVTGFLLSSECLDPGGECGPPWYSLAITSAILVPIEWVFQHRNLTKQCHNSTVSRNASAFAGSSRHYRGSSVHLPAHLPGHASPSQQDQAAPRVCAIPALPQPGLMPFLPFPGFSGTPLPTPPSWLSAESALVIFLPQTPQACILKTFWFGFGLGLGLTPGSAGETTCHIQDGTGVGHS